MINKKDTLEKGVCPDCQRETLVTIEKEIEENWSEGYVEGRNRFWILRCGACGKYFFGSGQTFSEDILDVYDHETDQMHMMHPERCKFYPRALSRPHPDWLGEGRMNEAPEIPKTLYEVYSALDNELPILAAIGMRTTIERLVLLLEAKTGLSFKEKIEFLRTKGYISAREKDYLGVLVSAGNSAAHQSWDPNSSELNTMIEILEGLLHKTLVLPEKVDKLRHRIPPKDAK